MSNLVFLLAAVGLSVLGGFGVWIHSRMRSARRSVGTYTETLRALALDDRRHDPPSGVRPLGVPPPGAEPPGTTREHIGPGP